MTLQKGTKNGFPIIEDSTTPGTAVTDMTGDGGDIVATMASWIADNKIYAEVFTLGTIIRKTSSGDVAYRPSADTDAARGAALTSAFNALANGDILVLGPKTYIPDNEIIIDEQNIKILGNNAIIKRKNATESTYVLAVTVNSGTKTLIRDLEIDGNQANVTLTTGRGEGLRISCNGYIELINVYAHDAPIADTANNFYLDEATGHAKLVNCKADNPAYANYRIRIKSSEFINCDSLITTYTGGKGRFWVMDGSPVNSCHIRGGTWKTNATMEVNSNFDPDIEENPLLADWCEELVIDGVTMDFGINHNNATADSFMKFDNVRKLVFRNVTQRCSTPGTLKTSNIESLMIIGLVREAWIDNVIADGSIRFASYASGYVPTDFCSISNSSFGVNQQINTAVSNLTQCALTVIENCRFMNIIGDGSGANRHIFDNYQMDGNQKVRIKNCHFHTSWPVGEWGTMFRLVQKIGSVALTDITITNDLNETYVALTNTQRLMATPHVGDPNTAFLGRNPLNESTLAALGSGTYASTNLGPVDPGSSTGDWFGNLVTSMYAGTRIINMNPAGGGNGFPDFFIKNATGKFVADVDA